MAPDPCGMVCELTGCGCPRAGGMPPPTAGFDDVSLIER